MNKILLLSVASLLAFDVNASQGNQAHKEFIEGMPEWAQTTFVAPAGAHNVVYGNPSDFHRGDEFGVTGVNGETFHVGIARDVTGLPSVSSYEIYEDEYEGQAAILPSDEEFEFFNGCLAREGVGFNAFPKLPVTVVHRFMSAIMDSADGETQQKLSSILQKMYDDFYKKIELMARGQKFEEFPTATQISVIGILSKFATEPGKYNGVKIPPSVPEEEYEDSDDDSSEWNPETPLEEGQRLIRVGTVEDFLAGPASEEDKALVRTLGFTPQDFNILLKVKGGNTKHKCDTEMYEGQKEFALSEEEEAFMKAQFTKHNFVLEHIPLSQMEEELMRVFHAIREGLVSKVEQDTFKLICQKRHADATGILSLKGVETDHDIPSYAFDLAQYTVNAFESLN